MFTTVTEFIRMDNSPETGSVIGWLASQQRLAYNHAVNVLNREPMMPKRARKGSRFGLNKRITLWRNTLLSERGINPAPYHVHQQGSEAAWQANARMQAKREERLERIEQAIEGGDDPHPSDIRPHRRTLRLRTRKHGTQTLTVRGKRFIQHLSNRSFRIEGVKHVFRTRDKLPNNMLSLHFVEMPGRRRSVNAPLSERIYQLHVTVALEVPDPPDLTDTPLECYEGVDDGVVNNWAFSDGERHSFVEPYPNRNVRRERRVQQGKKKGSRRKGGHQRECDRKNRIRKAERKRQFHHHAIRHLAKTNPSVVAVEQKQVSNMMRSARGKGRRQKAGLNRSLADAGLSELNQILGMQCLKRGVHVMPVPARGSSQSCPRCGYRHRNNRETQARFRCRHCGWLGNADTSASVILRNRAFVRVTERIHEYTPYAEDVPTGWKEQPSRRERQLMLFPAQNAHKPKRGATNPAGGASKRRAGYAARGPTTQVPGTKRSAGKNGGTSRETGHAEGVQTPLDVHDV